jgi:protocatechuate 3,4-dioxygenase beta subunit
MTPQFPNHSDDNAHDHDRGLAYDLDTIDTKMMGRRRALALFASAGTVGFLASCGGDGSSSGGGTASSSSTSSTTSSTGGSTTTSSTSSTTSSTSSGGSSTCIADPTETGGPFPGDGTNTANGGVTSNVLPVSGVVRSDIRPSFIGSTTVATGTQVTMTLTVVNVNAACAPLVGYAVYLWHCNRTGQYSLYDLPAESYLRGVQVTNASGQVTFTTIFPGCYAGRYPHMHFEIFSTLAGATTGRAAVLTSQLAMATAACNSVYADAALYPSSASRFASTTTANDNVFGDNSAAQITAMTPAFAGSVAAGYTATATIGIAV